MGGVIALPGTPVVAGRAEGTLLVTTEPLSFWGGLDPATGEVIDRRHDLAGQRLSGRVLALPHGRGSCSASGVLLEAICNGTGPVALLTSRVDPIIGLGAILADELHQIVVPVIVLDPADFARLRPGRRVAIAVSGCVLLRD